MDHNLSETIEKLDQVFFNKQERDETAKYFMGCFLMNYSQPMNDFNSLADMAYQAADSFLAKKSQQVN